MSMLLKSNEDLELQSPIAINIALADIGKNKMYVFEDFLNISRGLIYFHYLLLANTYLVDQ